MLGRISAIVPTFNRADYLRESVQALNAQTRPLHQVIVYNDGSSDHTEEVMANLSSPDATQLLCLSHANAGKSTTLNKAMAYATGDYIWICDDDDLVLPTAAEELGAILDTCDAALVAARHNRFSIDANTGAKLVIDTGYWPDLSQGSVLRHLLEDIFFFQPATLVRRSAYDAVGPFRDDLKRSIDYEMFVRLASRFPAVVIDKVLFEQRKHDGARGSGAALHSASEAEKVWKANDRAIFDRFRETLPLSLYQALFDGGQDSLRKRAALLQRGCVYARRSDWNAAVRDFRDAVSVLPDTAINATEHAIAVRAFAGKHGCAEAYDPAISRQLIDLKRDGIAGRSLCRSFARGSVWRLRQATTDRRLADAARIAGFILHAGLPGRTPADSAATMLRERRTLPRRAYAW